MPSLFAFFRVHAQFDPACTLVTSPWFGPATLAAVRLLVAFWTTVVLIVELVHGAAQHTDGSCVSLLFPSLPPLT
jgi:hypothetical protein